MIEATAGAVYLTPFVKAVYVSLFLITEKHLYCLRYVCVSKRVLLAYWQSERQSFEKKYMTRDYMLYNGVMTVVEFYTS